MYEKYYQKFSNEVHQILGSYLFWRMLHNRTSDEVFLQTINKTPLSWLITRQSLQVTLFITLGRVFDIDNDAFSVDDLLKCCIDEIDSFSLKNLKARKIADNDGIEPEWISEYIENAYEPVEQDFKRLRDEFSKHRKVFEKVYSPIRHKLIAHKDKEYIGKSDELWAEINIQELEGIIWFLNDLENTLFWFYRNGRKPELEGREPNVAFYEKDYEKLLDSIKNT